METMKKLLFILLIVFLFSCAPIKPVVQENIPEPEYIEGTAMLKVLPPRASVPQSHDPSFPLGKPDEISRYYDNGYSVISYTYYCYKGKYIVYTYTMGGDSSPWYNLFSALLHNWSLPSIYTSNGICDK